MIATKLFVTACLAGTVMVCLLPAQGRGGRGARRGGFTQYTRPLASADVLARGRALFESNCASCHASDLRGVSGKGNNILHSGITMNDKKGELVAAELKKHAQPITLSANDSEAVAEYIHSVLATMGGQGSPPRSQANPELNVLVGSATDGEAYFGKHCASCHSLTGDMKGIASKYSDPRALQNGWIAGTLPIGGGRGRGFGGRGGVGGVGNQATVTLPDGQKVEGRVVRNDDYLIILTAADGSRKVYPLDIKGPKPTIVVTDPQEAHKKMVLELDDPDNKNMHDVTAYLWTLK
jgi:cytochrome c oxidase cbb3-type subunit 3